MLIARTAAAAAATTIALLSAPTSHAHHPGAFGNAGSAGPIVTLSATTLEAGQLVAGISVDYTRLNSLTTAEMTAFVQATQDHAHTLSSLQSYALTAAYGITNDFMIGFRLPYVVRTDIREAHWHGHVGIHDLGDAEGIGDLTVLGQYRVYNNRASGTQVALLAGFKAPTGVTDRSHEGEVLGAEFQPGGGAWGGLLGAAFTQSLGGKWSFDANVLYALVTEGTQATDLGDQLLFNAAISYRVVSLGGVAAGPMWHGSKPHAHGADPRGHLHEESPGLAMDLVLEINGEWHKNQTIAGVKDPNSGGTTVYVSPGIRLSYDKVSGFASFGIPVVNEMNGFQAEPDWRLITGIAVAF